MLKILKKSITYFLDLIFPIECLGCDSEGTFCCQNCLQKIPLNKGGLIKPLTLENVDRILCAGDYKNPLLQKLIHNFKFRFLVSLNEPLAEIIINYYQKVPAKLDLPLIIAVPLHRRRFLERGFNQSALLAQKFAAYFNYQFQTNLLNRTKNTAHQVGLKREQRFKNILNAFKLKDGSRVQNRNVIILDDVLTTGATVAEAAKVLKQSGAKEIWVLSLAQD